MVFASSRPAALLPQGLCLCCSSRPIPCCLARSRPRPPFGLPQHLAPWGTQAAAQRRGFSPALSGDPWALPLL